MADKTKKPRTRGKIGRIRIGLNVLVQIVLILFLVAMANSLAFKHYARWDFSRDQKYTLSDKTKRFLDTLKGKMRITVFFSPNTPISGEVLNLLTEYQYAGKGKIDIEHIDPERNLSRAKELFDKYKVVTDESLLVLDYEGRSKTVKASEMADLDQSGMAFGEGPRVAAFKGEQAITSAMIDLVEGKKKTLGYVTGHKEPALTEGSSPIAVLKTFIENENIKFQELNLLDLDAIAANTPPDKRDPGRPWLLAPIDLQVIKAAGVTFAVSMLERVIEERARGNPSAAAAIRAEITRLVGDDLSRLIPGSPEAMRLKEVLIAQQAWSQYLEVGIGVDGHVDLMQHSGRVAHVDFLGAVLDAHSGGCGHRRSGRPVRRHRRSRNAEPLQ